MIIEGAYIHPLDFLPIVAECDEKDCATRTRTSFKDGKPVLPKGWYVIRFKGVGKKLLCPLHAPSIKEHASLAGKQ